MDQLTMLPPVEGRKETVRLRDIVTETGLPDPITLRSMAEHGQLVPVLLEENEGDYYINDGLRRVAAARELGWESVEAIVHRTGEVNGDIIGLVANSVRSNNSLAELDKITRLTRDGYEDKDITRITGIRAATITKRRRLLGLHPDAREAVLSGRLAIGTAEAMAGLPHHDQERILDEHPDGKITSDIVREARTVGKRAGWEALGLSGLATEEPFCWQDGVRDHLEAALSMIPFEAGTEMTRKFLSDFINGMDLAAGIDGSGHE